MLLVRPTGRWPAPRLRCFRGVQARAGRPEHANTDATPKPQLGVDAERKCGMGRHLQFSLTCRDVALCVTGSGVGLPLTGHSITELARQRAKPNVRQHPRRVLTRCAAHGRASPSTLLRRTEQTGSQAGCIPRLPNAEQSPSVRNDRTY